MKKILLFLISFILIAGFYGCSSNNNELQALKQENDSLKSNNASVQSSLDNMKSENESLKKELDEIKNGAEQKLNEINDAFNKKNYDAVIELSKELSETHAGSKEADEAEKLVTQVESIKKEEQDKADAEAEKAKEEAEKSAVDKAREIIHVKSVYTDDPNSAGGVDLHIVWQNTSSKVIKYISFEVVPYNAVNDAVSDQISGNSTFTGQETGPINAGQWFGEGRRWECAWYNNTIVRAELNQIDISYMDGSSASLKDKDIEYVKY